MNGCFVCRCSRRTFVRRQSSLGVATISALHARRSAASTAVAGAVWCPPHGWSTVRRRPSFTPTNTSSTCPGQPGWSVVGPGWPPATGRCQHAAGQAPTGANATFTLPSPTPSPPPIRFVGRGGSVGKILGGWPLIIWEATTAKQNYYTTNYINR